MIQFSNFARIVVFTAIGGLALFGQEGGPAAEAPALIPVDKRIAGVLPNYKMAELRNPFVAITPKQKFTISFKDSFDYPVVAISGFLAGISHLQNQNPGFGQGAAGYGRRFVRGYADQVIGNVLVEGLIPSITHDDPRFYRKGEGSTKSRVAWALTRVFVTRSDSGNWRFNTAEWLGTAGSVAISNLYYPESRSLRQNAQKIGLQVGLDSAFGLLKEFFPDFKQHQEAKKAAKK